MTIRAFPYADSLRQSPDPGFSQLGSRCDRGTHQRPERYALDLSAHHSKLILTGLSPGVIDQLEKTGAIGTFIPKADIFPATEVSSTALLQAYTAAQVWLRTPGSTV